jgi:DNA (cytosine-5)-methyltransferase 1
VSAPRILDAFCGEGGAGMGYHLAGFDVFGVDLNTNALRRYPFPSVRADALQFIRDHGHEFDAIHASPPCQQFSRMSNCRPGLADTYPDLIGSTRDDLDRIGRPYVIENVPGAPLRRDLELCGCQFGLRSPRGLGVRRTRWFETSPRLFVLLPAHNHAEPALPVTGHSPGKEWISAHVDRFGEAPRIEERRTAMGVEWMSREGTSEAIPPAYTEFIGEQLLVQLACERAS